LWSDEERSFLPFRTDRPFRVDPRRAFAGRDHPLAGGAEHRRCAAERSPRRELAAWESSAGQDAVELGKPGRYRRDRPLDERRRAGEALLEEVA
jgi:hypothetical protein